MLIPKNAIVSNSDMTKDYKACRDKAKRLNKIFIMKNDEPDGVLLSIAEYERLSEIIESTESCEKNDSTKILKVIPKEVDTGSYSQSLNKNEINQIVEIDIIQLS